jgi:hypothetical protein
MAASTEDAVRGEACQTGISIPTKLKQANELPKEIREKLTVLADGDPLLLFAYRRKIAKELQYDERGKPGDRRKVKAIKWGQQNGKCTHCGKELELGKGGGSTNGPCPNWSFSSGSNQISTSGYTYDAAGNLTSDGTDTYQWDAEGRLKGATGALAPPLTCTMETANGCRRAPEARARSMLMGPLASRWWRRA